MSLTNTPPITRRDDNNNNNSIIDDISVNNNNSNSNNNNDDGDNPKLSSAATDIDWWGSFKPEALSTGSLVVISCLFRGFISLLRYLVEIHNEQLQQQQQQQRANDDDGGGTVIVAVGWWCCFRAEVSGLILSFFPERIRKGLAPGFFFANPWILLPLRDRFGPIPNLPTRLSEMVLGRVTRRDLGIVIPVHFFATAIGAFVVRTTDWLLDAATLAHPVAYSEEGLWLVDLVREIGVTACFTVGLLAGTDLLKLNGIRGEFLPLLMLPLYLFGVDEEGRGSAFGPDILYALRTVTVRDEVPLRQSSHVVGPLIGGLLGGKIMTVFFPDAPQEF